MVTTNATKPKCKHCGAKVWRVNSGLVCDECASKIVPEALYAAQSFFPVDWAELETIKSRGRFKYNGRQPETLFEQNSRLAKHHERQRPLFES